MLTDVVWGLSASSIVLRAGTIELHRLAAWLADEWDSATARYPKAMSGRVRPDMERAASDILAACAREIGDSLLSRAVEE